MVEIYGTLGPSCASTEIMEEMFRAGMTGMRLNLSHISLADAAEQVEAFHTAAARAGVSPKLLIDMQGPELRAGALTKPIPLEAGQEIELGGNGIPMPAAVLEKLKPGQKILLDDGKLLLQVTENKSTGTVLRGGLLQSRKSIALPGLTVTLPALTEADLANLARARDFGVTGVMQPFVRSREDLDAIRTALDAAGGAGIRLFAKIESREGMERLESLLPAADEIVIARGDLGNAMPLWELPAAQKQIAAACSRAGKPFMVVTQMLSSMEHNPVPTRAEVSDIFNAVLDGAASVMVTGETAAGRYPVEVIRYLTATVREAERYRQ